MSEKPPKGVEHHTLTWTKVGALLMTLALVVAVIGLFFAQDLSHLGHQWLRNLSSNTQGNGQNQSGDGESSSRPILSIGPAPQKPRPHLSEKTSASKAHPRMYASAEVSDRRVLPVYSNPPSHPTQSWNMTGDIFCDIGHLATDVDPTNLTTVQIVIQGTTYTYDNVKISSTNPPHSLTAGSRVLIIETGSRVLSFDGAPVDFGYPLDPYGCQLNNVISEPAPETFIYSRKDALQQQAALNGSLVSIAKAFHTPIDKVKAVAAQFPSSHPPRLLDDTTLVIDPVIVEGRFEYQFNLVINCRSNPDNPLMDFATCDLQTPFNSLDLPMAPQTNCTIEDDQQNSFACKVDTVPPTLQWSYAHGASSGQLGHDAKRIGVNLNLGWQGSGT